MDITLPNTVVLDSPSDRHARRRTDHAGTTSPGLSHVWSYQQLSLCTKLRLYNSLVPSVLLHAAETWILFSNLERRLDVLNPSCVCRVACPRWYHRGFSPAAYHTATSLSSWQGQMIWSSYANCPITLGVPSKDSPDLCGTPWEHAQGNAINF